MLTASTWTSGTAAGTVDVDGRHPGPLAEAADRLVEEVHDAHPGPVEREARVLGLREVEQLVHQGLEARGGKADPLHRPALGRRVQARGRAGCRRGREISASGVRSSCETAARKLARSSSAARSARSSRSTTTAPFSRPAIAENEAAMGTSVPSSRVMRSSASTGASRLASTSSNRHRSPHRSPSGPVQRRHRLAQLPRPAGPALPSSGTAARLTRTTRRRSSTATIPSVVLSRIAASSACSPASSSRSWAAAEGDRQLVAHEAEEADTIGGQPRALLGAQGQEPDHPGTQLALAQVPALIERDAVPALGASPGLRGGHGREAAPGSDGRSASRSGSGSLATSRRPPSPGGVSHTAPATASLARTSSPMTDPAMSARSPPSASSWLSWYCAKTVSAWRWASSKLLRSSASVRAAVLGERRHQSREPEARSARNSR